MKHEGHGRGAWRGGTIGLASATVMLAACASAPTASSVNAKQPAPMAIPTVTAELASPDEPTSEEAPAAAPEAGEAAASVPEVPPRQACLESVRGWLDHPRTRTAYGSSLPARVEACMSDDANACLEVGLSPVAHNCPHLLLSFACEESGDAVACLGQALSLEDEEARREALEAVSHPLAAALAAPVDAPVPSCGASCVETLAQVGEIAPLGARRLQLEDRACVSDDGACRRAFDEVVRQMDAPHAGVAKHLQSPLAFCQRHRAACGRMGKAMDSTILDEVLCALGNGAICARGLALSLRNAGQPRLPNHDSAVVGCRLGHPFACLYLEPAQIREHKLRVVTCNQKPRACATVLHQAEAFVSISANIFGEHVVPLAGPACDQLRDPLACSVMASETPESELAQRIAYLRHACPHRGPTASGACTQLADALAEWGASTEAARVRDLACRVHHEPMACTPVGEAMLESSDPDAVKRGLELLDRACWGNSHAACDALHDHYTAQGDDKRADDYLRMKILC